MRLHLAASGSCKALYAGEARRPPNNAAIGERLNLNLNGQHDEEVAAQNPLKTGYQSSATKNTPATDISIARVRIGIRIWR